MKIEKTPVSNGIISYQSFHASKLTAPSKNPNQTNEEKGDRLTRDRPTPPPGGVGMDRIKDPGCGCWLGLNKGWPLLFVHKQ